MNKINTKSGSAKNTLALFLMMLFASLLNSLQAKEMIGNTHRQANTLRSAASGCGAPTAQKDLDISGVRATILTGGDMWWDLSNAKYEVPKQDNAAYRRTAIFMGSLWIGGYDQSNQLKTACQFYRQSGGNDFWPGPLDTTTVSVSTDVCVKYDRHWKLDRTDVKNFVDGKAAPTPDMVSWPGNGDQSKGQAYHLAPFEDKNGDGVYNPNDGDYPRFNFSDKPLTSYQGYLLGDEVLWWVFNDKGNTHLESRGSQIGLEVRAQSFAFNKPASDPVGLMTFCAYQVINRSTNTLTQTYFGVFVDPDLGAYNNDYVGCDANLGLGFCYNGTPFDHGTPNGYNDPPFNESQPPPCIGLDFFEGPLADPNGKDDPKDSTRSGTGYGDGIIDNEKLGMSRFVYFNNDFTATGNPLISQDYYNYLIGKWKDGRPMRYGGNGYNTATGGACLYMFPDSSDIKASYSGGQPWNEKGVNNPPGDRRFIQSAGQFTLKPGAVNYITFGVVFGHAASGDNYSSVNVVKTNDKIAQSLFDSKFAILRGPTMPTLNITELDKQLVITIVNPSTGNNANENYQEDDPSIIEDPAKGTVGTKTYKFQGYQIFQLKDPSSVSSVFDPTTGALDQSKAIVVAQCDLKDSLGLVDNFIQKQDGNYVPVPMVFPAAEPVNGSLNSGIKHTFVLNKDEFNGLDANKGLINNRACYFYVVAYGTNYLQYKLNQNFKTLAKSPVGYFKPYVVSSGTTVYKAIPHIPTMQNGGMVLQSKVGDGIPITRIYGSGNGLNSLNLDSITVSKILNNTATYRVDTLPYASGGSPIDIRVIDPTKVPTYNLVFKLDGTATSNNWILSQENGTGAVSQALSITTDYAIQKWGLSIKATQVSDPGVDNANNNNGAIQLPNAAYADSTNKWLVGIKDDNGGSTTIDAQADNESVKYDWIASGVSSTKSNWVGLDDGQNFETSTNGSGCAPFALCRSGSHMPGVSGLILSGSDRKTCLQNTSSVLLVLTPNKDQWTRSPVIETSETSTEGLAKFDLRKIPSVDKNGKPDPSGTKGLGWFPGYAIDMNTGERLNIIFGEDTYNAENGKDMLWNPSSKQVVAVENGFGSTDKTFVLGGKHFTYIVGHNGNMPVYDEGKYIVSQLSQSPANYKDVFKNVMWAMVPVMIKGKSMLNGIPPCKVTYRLLAAKSFKSQRYAGDNSAQLPYYSVNTKAYGALINNAKAAKDALESIRAVPNPYYAHSYYEQSLFDNFIKITNLPRKYTISIFSVDGTLIRTISNDSHYDTTQGSDNNPYKIVENENAYTWDLKNNAGITISSGLYIIHVKADGIGEKTIKWFGVIRPLDLQDF